MKKISIHNYSRYALLVAAGIFLGWVFFHSPGTNPEEHSHKSGEISGTWTCAMHPQIRSDKPGLCPICAMELVPVGQGSSQATDPSSVHLTREAARLADVQTTRVSSQAPVREVRLYGKVEADERLIQSQVSTIPGRIEKLLVNFTGETVQKGQTLAVVYSPELVTAQQELIEAAGSKQSQPTIYAAARHKLLQWKLTEAQVNALETSRLSQTGIEIKSTTSGIVTARRVNQGDYVSQGTVLFEVSDLSRVWILFEAYESDLVFLKKGDRIAFTLQALPGTTLEGNILFIDPVIDPVTRVAKVRVESSNPGGKLKPGMFASGTVRAGLEASANLPVIPRSAVLWTGKRSVVYVRQPGEEPVFKIREIELGPSLGNAWLVSSGLSEGEEVVTEGAFSVDAAAQLEGKSSMMNPSSEAKNQEVVTFRVSGNCDMCKERIEKAARSVNGVSTASWSADTKMITAGYDPARTNTDAIRQSIALAGHDTDRFKAPDDVYNKLPECCLYRK